MSQAIPIATGLPAGAYDSIDSAEETLLQRAERILSGTVREEDLMPMTDEIIRSLALSEAYIWDGRNGELIREERWRRIQKLLLDVHYHDQIVLRHRTDRGVCVLAIEKDINGLFESLSADHWDKVGVVYPDDW